MVAVLVSSVGSCNGLMLMLSIFVYLDSITWQVSESLPPIIIHLTLQPGPIIMVRGLKSKLCPVVVAWWLLV